METRSFWYAPSLDRSMTDAEHKEAEHYGVGDRKRVDPEVSAVNLIGSQSHFDLDGEVIHLPTLDIDFPVYVKASSSPGKGHLYIDKPLTWDQYRKVLEVLGEVGILEAGYVAASIERKGTFVRPPGVLKPDATITPFDVCGECGGPAAQF